MTGFNELKIAIRRNKLLGAWAAEKLGLIGRYADAYADALAVGTVDPERSDVFSKIRKDKTQLIDWIHEAVDEGSGIIINPAARCSSTVSR